MDEDVSGPTDDERVVARAATGPVAVVSLPELERVDVAALPASARVDLVVACERLKARLDALQQVALAAVVGATEATGLQAEMARHEVGAALRLSPGAAYDRTRVAAVLCRRLPSTLSALREGRISYGQARAVADAVRDLSAGHAAAVQERVLGPAEGQTVAETRRCVARAVLAVDPAGAEQRHATAFAGRRVGLQPLPDAMAGLWVELAATDAHHVWTALTAHANASKQRLRAVGLPDPGVDALRVDTLVALITGAGRAAQSDDDGPAVPRCRCGGRATAAVVVDLPTVLRLAEHPGELAGFGPIPAFLARELAADLDWVRWTVDPGTGRLLDVGSERYRPGRRLASFIAAAHDRCGFPGCSRPASGCDLDHVTNHDRGGPTDLTNLGPLCRQHHNAKTHGHWRLAYDHDSGRKTWTSPLGKTYVKPPTRHLRA